MFVTTPDHISGGYFLIKPKARDAWHPAHLVRDPIVSASGCMRDGILPDTEWFSNGDRAQLLATAARLGLTDAEVGHIQAWVEASCRGATTDKLRWPTVFASVEALRELVAAIGRVPAGFIAIGIALPRDLVPRMLSEPEKTKDTEVWGQLAAALPPAPGVELGWEVLGRETVEGHMNVLGFHSWLCNGMEEDAQRKFGIPPNARGFIDIYEDAKRVAEYCDKIQPEPGVWLPWLITQYEIG